MTNHKNIIWMRDSEPIILILKNSSKGNRLLIYGVGMLSLLAFIGPIIFMVVFIEEITSKFFISVIIFWFVGFYLLRLALWNIYGREFIEISKSRIKIHHDFKYFKLFHGDIKTTSISISFLLSNSTFSNNSNSAVNNRVLVFRTGDKSIKTSIPLKLSETVKIRNEILSYLQTIPN